MNEFDVVLTSIIGSEMIQKHVVASEHMTHIYPDYLMLRQHKRFGWFGWCGPKPGWTVDVPADTVAKHSLLFRMSSSEYITAMIEQSKLKYEWFILNDICEDPKVYKGVLETLTNGEATFTEE